MDAHEQQPPVSEPLRSTTPIPIAKLAPELENLSDSSIHAVVTLLWPYSSSTRSLSLLLAEPDFRLRRTNGQVKVVFHGLVAEEVAKSHVGIGDTVYIRLAGSRFVDNGVSNQTPGRCIAWDINYDDGVSIEIWRSSQHLSTVQVDRPSSPPPTIDNAIEEAPSTPPANGYPRPDGTSHNASLQAWQSPAFVERSRTSLGHLSSSIFDPFAEEDGFVPGKGRKRPRFSMRGSDWRLVDEPASPEDIDIPGDWTAMFDDEEWLRAEIGEDDAEDTKQSPEPSEPRDVVPVSEGPPDGAQAEVTATESEQVTPESTSEKKLNESRSDAEFLVPGIVSRTEAPSPRRHGIPNFAGHLSIDTPRLHPIPSPGLPVPSPLVSTSNSPFGYFGAVSTTGQTQSTPPTTVSQDAADLALEAISEMPPETIIRNSDEHVTTMVNEEATTLSGPVSQMREVGSGSEVGHAVSLHGMTNSGAQDLEAMHAQDTTPSLSGLQTATPHTAFTFGIEGGDTEGAMPHEEERAKVEEDEERLDALGQFEARADSSMAEEEKGIYHSVVETAQHDLEGEDHEYESASQSSIIEDARSEALSEEYVSEEDEQPDSRARHDIELISESEAESPEKSHDAVRREYGYYPEDDEEEELDEEEGISDEEPESEELEDDYDEDGYDDRVDSELELQEDELEAESPHPIKKAEPEVIVLDSDSDEEPSPSVPRQPAAAPAATYTREPDVSSSADEASSYGASEPGEYEEYESEEVDDAEGEDYSDEDGEEGGEWFVRDNQEAQEREVEPVEVDLIRQSREIEGSEVSHSDELQVAHKPTMEPHSDDEAVGVEQVDHGHQSEGDVDMDDGQRDTEDADVKAMEAESVQDEEMHDLQTDDDQNNDEQSRDETVGDEKAHYLDAHGEDVQQEPLEEPAGAKEPEVVHIEDEATEEPDHLAEGREESGLIESTEGAVLRAPSDGAEQSIDIEEHPGYHAEHEELRMTEVISHEAHPEEIAYAQETINIAQQDGASTETVLQYPEPPIDPELFSAGTFPTEISSEQHGAHTSHEQIQDGEDADVPEQAQHIDPSLSLDGASQSLGLPDSAAHVPKMPILPQNQLVTPESSQINGVDISSVHVLPVDAALPTPEPTQERSEFQVEDEPQPTVEVVTETTATVVAENLPQDEDAQSEAESISTAPEEQAISDDDKGAHTTHSEDEVLLVGHDRKHLLNLNRNYPGLRSKYSYFAPLATLIDHYNALTDTISIVSETRPAIRSTTGKKDYILTFGVTDPSLAGTILYAQIFRPYKTALPTLEEGDAILLRNFKVKSFKHSITLSSVDSSAWAVFNGPNEARIDGPPVEYGTEEQTYATDLRQWYHEDGMAMVADYQLQASIEQESREATPYSTGGFSDSGSVNNVDGRADSSFSSSRGSGSGSRRRKSHRRVTIHELRDGRRYAEVGSPSSKEDIHELRDGTVYANF